jgi:2-aminoadipate transaminase
MVADRLPWDVDPAQVLITTGSQQGLDLVAKVLADAGSRVLVETAHLPRRPAGLRPDGARDRQRGQRRHGVDVDDLQRQWEMAPAAASCMCCPISRTPPAAP